MVKPIAPIFCPDATRGVVRGLDTQDLAEIGVETMIVNTLHLAEKPGLNYLEKIGGVKKLMGWSGKIISDSGGFQLFSMFHRHPGLGKVVDEGLKIYSGSTKQKYKIFTPEESIATQFAIGSDIMVCLDDFTPPEPTTKRLEESVWRTIDWARRSKAEFERQYQKQIKKNKKLGLKAPPRPQLFAPLQGHPSRKWRQFCAQELLKIGFDGYGLGGWLIDPQTGKIDLDATAFNTEIVPDPFPRYAMGVGKPEDITTLYALGYTIFDCVIPTRDARHGRLSVFNRQAIPHLQNWLKTHLPSAQNLPVVKNNSLLTDFYNYFYMDKSIFATDNQPLDSQCHCHTCQNYSRAYLHHLYKIKDASFSRLATIHNLYFYQELIEIIAQSFNE